MEDVSPFPGRPNSQVRAVHLPGRSDAEGQGDRPDLATGDAGSGQAAPEAQEANVEAQRPVMGAQRLPINPPVTLDK